MRIVVLGATRFSLRCLQALDCVRDCEVVGTVTTPQNFSISYCPTGVTNVLHADIASYCAARHLPCEIMTSSMHDSKLLERVKGWDPEAFLVVGWYHLLPISWRGLAPAYGLHASLLPDYSGGAPLVWAMINGESRTGITLFQLADGVDNGPVVGQLEVEINSDDTIASLYERVEALGLRLLAHYFPRIAAGSAVFLAQDESRRRIMPQRSPGDGQIDWNWPASRIRNFVRAQTHPYPGAFTCLRGSLVKIWAAREWSTPAPTMSPGLVALHDGHVIVGCSNSVIELAIVEAEGQELPASEWWKRYVPRHHERFA